MPGTDDSEREAAVERLASRAFEEALVREREELQADIAILKSRGIRLDSSTPRHVLEKAWQSREDRAATTVQAIGRRLIGEAIGMVQRMHGQLAQQTLDWLRGTLPVWFDRAADDYLAAFRPKAGDDMIRRVEARLEQVKGALRRDLEIELAPYEFRVRLDAIATGSVPGPADGSYAFDVFISHASEDKADVALPLSVALKKRGLSVWLDELELVVGRSLFRSIEDGLRRSRCGVVILSPNFFKKEWPRRELSALAALSDAAGRDMILPVWHEVDFKAVARGSPLLADVHAARTSNGLERVADEIATAIARGVQR